MAIWNPNKECMSRDEMSALQGKRLHKIVDYVYHNVPFYRHKLQELDIVPDDIQTIEDIMKLPFWVAGRTAELHHTHPCVEWHHRQSYHRRIHP